MYALVTGASSGIGKECAYILAERGYDIIMVARSIEKLEEIKNDLFDKFKINVVIIKTDLSNREELEMMLEESKKYDIEVVINNAGFGKVGMFNETPNETDYQMIDLNVVAMHMIIKHFSEQMNNGYILTVASIAAFAPGPKMATYYATKNYIYSYARAVDFELKKLKKSVSITVLCPGPVSTGFNDVANVNFSLDSISSTDCAKYAIKKMFKRRKNAFPSLKVKMGIISMKFLPKKMIMRVCYHSQSKKEG